jgi:hypothetical protein
MYLLQTNLCQMKGSSKKPHRKKQTIQLKQTIREVQTTIKNEIDKKKAPRYELITGRVLKKILRKVNTKVTQIINAEVIMLPKPGKPTELLTLYRPIILKAGPQKASINNRKEKHHTRSPVWILSKTLDH